jgi:hypothetical protein
VRCKGAHKESCCGTAPCRMNPPISDSRASNDVGTQTLPGRTRARQLGSSRLCSRSSNRTGETDEGLEQRVRCLWSRRLIGIVHQRPLSSSVHSRSCARVKRQLCGSRRIRCSGGAGGWNAATFPGGDQNDPAGVVVVEVHFSARVDSAGLPKQLGSRPSLQIVGSVVAQSFPHERGGR